MHAFFQKKRWVVLVVILIGLATVSVMFFKKEQKIDFNAQIRPILNKNCITCHGGVKQNGGFSVLFREEALGNTESGKPAIIPGDPEHSEFIRRITTHDTEERMPLEKNPLSQDEIDLLRTWVKQGAVWDEHWAFKKPLLPEVPEVNDSHQRINEIDNFIIEKLEPMGLAQSPQAAKSTLLRRASLDIIGCLPDSLISTRYLNDSSDNAYEHLVDDLLASPKYGEKWTSLWLDLSRYADSKGYEKDMHRETWPYRDWLIRSLNSDMPYDEFITQQLAGDLLHHPTNDQLIATVFNRNSMANDEGGTDDEEFRTVSVIDRVNTTFEVFQGITFGCVQCHSHPYEPIHHADFYRFLAFFNNSADADLPSDFPL